MKGKGEFERSKVSPNHSALSFAGVKSKRDLKRGSASLQGVGCQIKITGVKSMNLLHRGEGKRMMFPLTFYQTKASRGQVDLRKNPGNEADRGKILGETIDKLFILC